MEAKHIGKTNLKVSPLGLGCWAIGGQFTLDGLADGWGEVDDDQSIAAIHCALEMGVNFFDTSDAYGAGHSEEVLGRAMKGKRDRFVIATKFGFKHNRDRKEVYTQYDVSPAYVRQACEASLRRLGTDYIDLYQIHVGQLSYEETESVIDTLNVLRMEGKIRAYGWSTMDVHCARMFAELSEGAAIQHALNVLDDFPEMIEICEQFGLSSINNTPLAMGLLSGKFHAQSKLPADDVRGSGHAWVKQFQDGKPLPHYLTQLDAIREILTSKQRTLVQGALGWLWARSESTIPIPGFKTVAQAAQLAQAMEFGPLSQSEMDEINTLLGRQFAVNLTNQ